jgi:hypothetical protein
MQGIFTNGNSFDVKFMSRSAISKDTWRSARKPLSPALQMNLSDPSLYSAPLKAHSAAPLAALARTDTALQVRVSKMFLYCWHSSAPHCSMPLVMTTC